MESAKTAISTLVSNLKQVGYHPQVSVTHAPLKRARQPETDGCNCGVFACAYVWALVNDHPLDFDIENFDGDLWCAGPKHEPPLEMGPQPVDFFLQVSGTSGSEGDRCCRGHWTGTDKADCRHQLGNTWCPALPDAPPIIFFGIRSIIKIILKLINIYFNHSPRFLIV